MADSEPLPEVAADAAPVAVAADEAAPPAAPVPAVPTETEAIPAATPAASTLSVTEGSPASVSPAASTQAAVPAVEPRLLTSQKSTSNFGSDLFGREVNREVESLYRGLCQETTWIEEHADWTHVHSRNGVVKCGARPCCPKGCWKNFTNPPHPPHHPTLRTLKCGVDSGNRYTDCCGVRVHAHCAHSHFLDHPDEACHKTKCCFKFREWRHKVGHFVEHPFIQLVFMALILIDFIAVEVRMRALESKRRRERERERGCVYVFISLTPPPPFLTPKERNYDRHHMPPCARRLRRLQVGVPNARSPRMPLTRQ